MLKITISGGPAEGKTTLASEIVALLESLKMDVTIEDYDLTHDAHPSDVHEHAVEAMAGREVLVTTKQPQVPINIPHFWNK